MLNLRAAWPASTAETQQPVARLVHPAPAVTTFPARPGRRLHLMSFVFLVMLPILAAAIYWLGVAADEYVAELRFTLRAAEEPQMAPDWLASASQSQSALELRILVQYATSRTIIDDIGQSLDLRKTYASPAADWWSRLALPATIEALVAYWRGRVDALYNPADATVVIAVRAFSPEDALQVAQAVVGACDHLVNDLSLKMRKDALRQSEAELAETRARLTAVLAEIRAFRDRTGLIDPAKTAAATADVAGRLQEDLVRANARLTTLQTYMHGKSPTIAVLKAQIRSLETQQRSLALAVAAPEPSPGAASSGSVGSFEALENRRKFAEDAYSHALAGLDRARAEADRQQVYIANFVPPTLPEEPLYPHRWRSLGVVALFAFAIWAIGGLTLKSIRDHL